MNQRTNDEMTRCEKCGCPLDPEDATTWGYVPGWGVVHLCDRCYQEELDKLEMANQEEGR